MQTILVIDDDRDMCILLNRFLSSAGYKVHESYSARKALDYLNENRVDLVICDLRLEDMDGIALLRKIKELYSQIPVIMITGYSDIRTSVQAIKQGAVDYVTKPLLPDEILHTIQQAIDGSSNGTAESKLNSKKAAPLQKESALDKEARPAHIFGETPSFKQIIRQIELVAPTNYSVIIYGESGSGKEVIAQEIHNHSKRSDKPFVAIDCGALSRELAGSELFGHEKGSFTGALNQKVGSFEVANGGTIFLDEIANLSYEIQVSLLRVVQERKMRRVGSTKDIDLDVRILIASNEKLWDAIKTGRFREDLFHRFNEFNIDVPPLRERKDDIMLFAHHFLALTNTELDKQVKGFSPEVEEIFNNYSWPGNLRELKNVIKRATLLTDASNIGPQSLPFEIVYYQKLLISERPPVSSDLNGSATVLAKATDTRSTKDMSLKEVSIDAEYQLILDALKKANYNKSKAARILRIDRKTLYNKMNQYRGFKSV